MTEPSLERIYPDDADHESIAGHETKHLHLERYKYAGNNLAPGIIADIACGSGYGSSLLASQYKDHVKKIIAVDNSPKAIEYAKQHYTHASIDFIQEDALYFRSTVLLNTIISLETIEHLPEPGKFINHLAGQLTKGGRFIASAPITPSMDANPYHLYDFTAKSFKNLFINAGLTEINSFIQVQRYNPFQLFSKKEGRSKGIRNNLMRYYLKNPGKFFLRIASLLKNGFCNKYLVVLFEKK